MTQAPTITDHTVAVFETHDQAEAALKTLSDSGYDLRNLSIVGQNYQTEEHPIGFVNTGDRMWAWGKLGAFWGTVWGLLFGSAMMFVPGVGHVVFAGWLVGALQGALFGGGIGALGGAFSSIGIPENSVVEYESALQAGSFLLLAHGSEADVTKAKELLATTPATRIDSYTAKHDRHAGCH